MTDIVERLEAHMGLAEIQDVLPDCKEAAVEIRKLRAALAESRELIKALSRTGIMNSDLAVEVHCWLQANKGDV
jgi:hypothetical protein